MKTLLHIKPRHIKCWKIYSKRPPVFKDHLCIPLHCDKCLKLPLMRKRLKLTHFSYVH